MTRDTDHDDLAEPLDADPYGADDHPRGVIAERQWHVPVEPYPGMRWPVTYALVSGGIGDYAVYLGVGSPEWVAERGNKLGFDEALAVFPLLERRRYRE